MESLKKVVKDSSEKLFEIAEKSLENHNLERVILMKRVFRCDIDDPNGLRHKLSEYGNRVLDDIWLDKGCPKNIILGQQHLEGNPEQIIQRFGDPLESNFDGVNLRGKLAVQHYTRSFLNVLLDNLPSTKVPDHMLFQPSSHYKQRSYASVTKPMVPQPGVEGNNYSIPVSNRYSILGNL